KQQSAHAAVAAYFETRDLDFRTVEELPWQLARAESWSRLYELLADPAFVRAAWDSDPFEVKAFWTEIELKTPLRMVDAYRPMLDALDRYPPESVWRVGRLLGEGGYA